MGGGKGGEVLGSFKVAEGLVVWKREKKAPAVIVSEGKRGSARQPGAQRGARSQGSTRAARDVPPPPPQRGVRKSPSLQEEEERSTRTLRRE